MSVQMRRAKGSTTPIQYPTFESPADHGWTVRRIDSDGVRIWELRENGQAIAAMKPRLNSQWCDVAMLPDSDKPEWVEIPGSYAEITEAVHRLYCSMIDDDQIFSEGVKWDDDPEDSQPEPDSIPFDGQPCYYPEGVL